MVLKRAHHAQPVIAAVNGPAAGAGMTRALAAGHSHCAERRRPFSARIFQRSGLYPAYGGTFSAAAVGISKGR